MREALSKTKIEWYPIPIGLGIGYLAFNHFRKIASKKYDDDGVNEGVENVERKKRIRPDGPWYAPIALSMADRRNYHPPLSRTQLAVY